MLTSGVQNCNRVLEWMIQCVVLAVRSLPLPYVHLTFTWRHSRDECSQAFPVLHQPCIIVNANGGGLGTRQTRVYQRKGHNTLVPLNYPIKARYMRLPWQLWSFLSSNYTTHNNCTLFFVIKQHMNLHLPPALTMNVGFHLKSNWNSSDHGCPTLVSQTGDISDMHVILLPCFANTCSYTLTMIAVGQMQPRM